MFVPPDTLSFAPLQFHIPYDPVTMLREAISAGHAHHDGTTQLDGRTVERIRIDPRPAVRFPAVVNRATRTSARQLPSGSNGVPIRRVRPDGSSRRAIQHCPTFSDVRIPASNAGQCRARQHPSATPGRDRTVPRRLRRTADRGDPCAGRRSSIGFVSTDDSIDSELIRQDAGKDDRAPLRPRLAPPYPQASATSNACARLTQSESSD